MSRLFALDQGFPQPLVDAAAPYFVDVELVPIRRIDTRLGELDDWEVLLALHHHERAFDGLITTASRATPAPSCRRLVARGAADEG